MAQHPAEAISGVERYLRSRPKRPYLLYLLPSDITLAAPDNVPGAPFITAGGPVLEGWPTLSR